MLFHLCYQSCNMFFARFQMWSDFAAACWDHKLWTKFSIATLSGLMINQRHIFLAAMQPKWSFLDGRMCHRGARGGCMGNSEVVEKGFVNLPPLCTLHFVLALCTLYFKKVSPICCHFALCTLHFALRKRFLHFAATLHQLLSRRVAAPRPYTYSWCQRMCGKGLNL